MMFLVLALVAITANGVGCTLPSAAVTGYDFTPDEAVANCVSGAAGCTTPDLAGVSCKASENYVADGSITLTYTGTGTDEACTDAAVAVTFAGGCVLQAPVQCKTPAAAVTGYVFTVNTDVTDCMSDACTNANMATTGVTCADGYGSGATVATVCTTAANGEFVTLGGCDPTVCVSPAAGEVGYTYTADHTYVGCDSVTCVEATAATDISLACAATHVGTAAVTQCTVGAAAVTFSGCNLQCKAPATAAGYTGFTPDADITDCDAATCDSATAVTNSAVSCAAGFVATTAGVSVTGCTSGDDDVTFAGCEAAVTCVAPAAAVTGYTFTAATLTCTTETCDSATAVSELTLTCDTNGGFVGTAAVGMCTSDATAVTFSGCDMQCKTPADGVAGYTYTGDADISGCTSGTCDSAAAVTTSSVACAANWEGAPTVTGCDTAAAAVTFGGCTEPAATQCTYPAAAVDGYTFVVDDPITDCTATTCTQPTISATCAAGYTGTVGIVAACTDSAVAVVLNGCELSPVQCKYPAADVAGYTFTVNTDVTDCTSSACTAATGLGACASGYTGTPVVATVCTTAANGEFVTLGGCTAESTATDCKTPAAAVTGYTFTVDTVIAGCAVGACTTPTLTDITCATGYSGTVAVTVCTDAAANVVLGGCTADSTGSVVSVGMAVASTIALAMF